MAVVARISSSLYTSVRDVGVWSTARSTSVSKLPFSNSTRIGTAFATGPPLLICKPAHKSNFTSRSASISIRCEQSTKESNSLDVWLGRLAMVGFAVAVSVEIATGKGLLENFGLTAPLPTVALAVTALVGVLAAVFIFQSASKN